MVVEMNEILRSLCNGGNLKMINKLKYMEQNKNSLRVLEDRRKSDDISLQYTATYDILFRIIDLELNSNGYTLNKSPHFVFKKLYPIFFPSIKHTNININEVVQVRHKVKKGKYMPTDSELEILYKLYEHAMENSNYNERS